MKSINISTFVTLGASVLALASCAHTAPNELVSARAACERSDASQADALVPAELHLAQTALGKAERSFDDAPDSFQTRDLSYVAQRKCEKTLALASSRMADRTTPPRNHLPGGVLVDAGLRDIEAGRDGTVEALLVWIAYRRLLDLGLPMPRARPTGLDAEFALYRALAQRHPDRDPYPLYNSLLRELVSFCRASDGLARG